MDAALRAGTISLADVADFRLGAMMVSPSTRQVTHGRDSITLEPRVLQVLVALAQADGRVVSREALFDRCWDGMIVGDNAINRVIARLRRLAEDTGCFVIETVPRVGYRLRPIETEPAEPPPLPAKANPPAVRDAGGTKRPFDRRWLLIGGMVALGAGGTALLWRPTGQSTATQERAAALVAKARIFSEVGVRSASDQAIRMLEEAVALDPASAQAWGALALALANHVWWAWEAEAEDFSARAREAAERAQAIDPDNADAALALVVRQNWFGRWTEHEHGLRAVIARHPDHPAAREKLVFLLCQAGRWLNGLALFEAAAGNARLPPLLCELYGTALAARDRRLEADRVLAEGVANWPSVPTLWSTRFEYLLSTGRLAEARAMVTDHVRIEFPQPTIPIDLGIDVTKALETRPGDALRAQAAAKVLAARENGAIWSPAATRLLMLLDEPGAALKVARAYLVGGTSPGGRVILPPTRFALRRTDFLFLPFMAPLRSLDGFADMAEAIGLAAHWRQTGTAPQMVA
jgi:DNA-binding winged helix-turn-helix (wHTH) protein/Tfp pilus assembly protein PilF